MVYFIKDREFVKIGYTTDFKKRFSQLQTSTPHNLTVLAIIKGDYETEKFIHNKFSDYHHRGEWFYINSDIEDFIKSKDDVSWQYGIGQCEENGLNPLQDLRLSLHKSMQDVGDILGVAKQSVKEAETRCMQGKVTIGLLHRYAKAMGHKLEYRFIPDV